MAEKSHFKEKRKKAVWLRETIVPRPWQTSALHVCNLCRGFVGSVNGSVGIYGTYDISIRGRVLIKYVTSMIKLNGLTGYTVASQLGN